MSGGGGTYYTVVGTYTASGRAAVVAVLAGRAEPALIDRAHAWSEIIIHTSPEAAAVTACLLADTDLEPSP